MSTETRARSVARTEALLLVSLVLFVAATVAAQELLGLDEPLALPRPVALLLLLVPALLWLGYFYLQDRHEPEPKHYVFGVFLLGGFVAFPIAGFLAALTGVPPWSGERLDASTIFAAIVPLGLAQEFAKFLVVRYSVYLSDEFDEPMDGIIYMTSAGIGFAVAENLAGLDAHRVHLATFVMNATVTTLAHGSIAGVLGYTLGVARFAPAGPRGPALLVGLLSAATLNGVFGLLQALVRVNGLQVVPWRGVAFASVFAGCVFAGVLTLMRRHLERSTHV